MKISSHIPLNLRSWLLSLLPFLLFVKLFVSKIKMKSIKDTQFSFYINTLIYSFHYFSFSFLVVCLVDFSFLLSKFILSSVFHVFFYEIYVTQRQPNGIHSYVNTMFFDTYAQSLLKLIIDGVLFLSCHLEFYFTQLSVWVITFLYVNIYTLIVLYLNI